MPFEVYWFLLLLAPLAPLLLLFGLIALNAAYPGWWADLIHHCRHLPQYIRDARKQARIRKWQCTACGYDLRGNLSGTCPECGAEVEFLPPRILHRRR